MSEKIMVEFDGEQMDKIMELQKKTKTETVQSAIMYSVDYTMAMHTGCFNCNKWNGTDCIADPYTEGCEKYGENK